MDEWLTESVDENGGLLSLLCVQRFRLTKELRRISALRVLRQLVSRATRDGRNDHVVHVERRRGLRRLRFGLRNRSGRIIILLLDGLTEVLLRDKLTALQVLLDLRLATEAQRIHLLLQTSMRRLLLQRSTILRAHLASHQHLLLGLRLLNRRVSSVAKLLNAHLQLFGLVEVLCLDSLLLLGLQVSELLTDRMQPINGLLVLLRHVKVFFAHCLVLLLLQLLNLDRCLRIEAGSGTTGVRMTGRWQRGLRLSSGRDGLSERVQTNQTNLVEHVEVVHVRLVEYELEQHGGRVNVDGLEFTRGETAALVGIER